MSYWDICSSGKKLFIFEEHFTLNKNNWILLEDCWLRSPDTANLPEVDAGLASRPAQAHSRLVVRERRHYAVHTWCIGADANGSKIARQDLVGSRASSPTATFSLIVYTGGLAFATESPGHMHQVRCRHAISWRGAVILLFWKTCRWERAQIFI